MQIQVSANGESLERAGICSTPLLLTIWLWARAHQTSGGTFQPSAVIGTHTRPVTINLPSPKGPGTSKSFSSCCIKPHNMLAVMLNLELQHNTLYPPGMPTVEWRQHLNWVQTDYHLSPSAFNKFTFILVVKTWPCIHHQDLLMTPKTCFYY